MLISNTNVSLIYLVDRLRLFEQCPIYNSQTFNCCVPIIIVTIHATIEVQTTDCTELCRLLKRVNRIRGIPVNWIISELTDKHSHFETSQFNLIRYVTHTFHVK